MPTPLPSATLRVQRRMGVHGKLLGDYGCSVSAEFEQVVAALARALQMKGVGDAARCKLCLRVTGPLENEAVMSVRRERIALGKRVIDEKGNAQAVGEFDGGIEGGVLVCANGGAQPVQHIGAGFDARLAVQGRGALAQGLGKQIDGGDGHGSAFSVERGGPCGRGFWRSRSRRASPASAQAEPDQADADNEKRYVDEAEEPGFIDLVMQPVPEPNADRGQWSKHE